LRVIAKPYQDNHQIQKLMNHSVLHFCAKLDVLKIHMEFFMTDTPARKWQCIVCGLVYDEALGWPDDGIAPGTAWEDVPGDWLCPDCGVGKDDFEMIAF